MPKRSTGGWSEATARAYRRRTFEALQANIRFQWFLDNVSDKVRFALSTRVRMATDYVRNRVVLNISVPVGRASSLGRKFGARTRRKGREFVTTRSRPGEFPRADTTQLMRTIFKDFAQIDKYTCEGYVGTPLDYGLILEVSTKLNRSFLRRTLNEELPKVRKLLSDPIK